MKKILILTIIFILISAAPVFASEIQGTGIEGLDLSGVERYLRGSGSGIDIGEMIQDFIGGKSGFSPQEIMDSVLDGLFSEFRSMVYLIRNMLLISVVAAMFKNLSSSFARKEASEIGFFASYAAVTLLLMQSFSLCASLAQGLIIELCGFMEAAIPVILSLMVTSGKLTSAYVFNPLLLFINNFIATLARDFVVTALCAAVALELINHISSEDLLKKLSDLIRKSISWALKSLAVLFIAIITFQSIASPIGDNTVTRSAKAVVDLVPIVGESLAGAVDSVAAWSSAVKGGALAAMLVIFVTICLGPILKLTAFIIIFKLTAALIQPISEPRFVKAIDGVGGYVSLLLGAAVLVTVIFMFAVIICLSI